MACSEGTHEIIKNPNGYIFKCDPLEINSKKLSEIFKIVKEFQNVIDAYENEIKANNEFYNIRILRDIIDNFELVVNNKVNKRYFLSGIFKECPKSTGIYIAEKISTGYLLQVNFDKVKLLKIDEILEIFDVFIALNEEHYCKKLDIDEFYDRSKLFMIYEVVLGSLKDKSINRLANYKRDREEALRFIGQ